MNIEKYLIEEKRDYEFAKVRAQIAGERLIRKCASLDLQKMLDQYSTSTDASASDAE